MSRSRRVTTHDVAARAGVSQATVSLVLGGNPRARVAEQTRERVKRAAEELGYRPNLLARGLVQRRSYAIAVVVPDLSNPFYSEVVGGVERVAAGDGYAVLLCDAREIAVAKHVETLRSRLIDGLIIDAMGASTLPEAVLEDLNVVLIDEPTQRLPGVASDAEGAGRLAAEHLLDLGHRRIGLVGPATDTHAFRMRERGFVGALRERSVFLRSDWLRRSSATLAGGQEAMAALLKLPERPTGVFFVNDLAALGALKVCISRGIAVPGDVSLIGCDDIEMARVVTPELSTVAVPARELGARAARLLLRRLSDPTYEARRGRLIPVKLMARGTTGPPREA